MMQRLMESAEAAVETRPKSFISRSHLCADTGAEKVMKKGPIGTLSKAAALAASEGGEGEGSEERKDQLSGED